MNITEKAAYLRGLADGLDVSASKEGRLLKELIDLVQEMAGMLTDVDSTVASMGDEIDDLVTDVESIEDILDECSSDSDEDDEEDEKDEEDEDLYEITCPSCGEKLYMDFSELSENSEIGCPACGGTIALDFPEHCCDECGCDECNHEHGEGDK